MTDTDAAINERNELDARQRASDDPAEFAEYLEREYPNVARVTTRTGFAWQDIMRAVELLRREAQP